MTQIVSHNHTTLANEFLIYKCKLVIYAVSNRLLYGLWLLKTKISQECVLHQSAAISRVCVAPECIYLKSLCCTRVHLSQECVLHQSASTVYKVCTLHQSASISRVCVAPECIYLKSVCCTRVPLSQE